MIDFEKLPEKLRIRGYAEDREVYLENDRLLPGRSQKVWNHSPDGFNWGYSGSGPAQLSLAILLRYLPDEQASRLHQRFKFAFVAALPFSQDFDVTINFREIVKDLYDRQNA